MKDGAREPVRLVFEDFVQYGIERNNQKGLQRLIDQIKPLHLTDNIEYLVLIAHRINTTKTILMIFVNSFEILKCPFYRESGKGISVR